MCLAIPGKIVKISSEEAVVNYDGLEKTASTRLYPTVSVGDYVLVHAGFIIQILSEDEGYELLRLNREIEGNLGR